MGSNIDKYKSLAPRKNSLCNYRQCVELCTQPSWFFVLPEDMIYFSSLKMLLLKMEFAINLENMKYV